jgi:WD40 repeat protein
MAPLVLAVLPATCLISLGCAEDDLLERTIKWPAKELDVASLGASGVSIFAVSKNPKSLEVWQWSDKTIAKRYQTAVAEETLSVAIAGDNTWISHLWDRKTEQADLSVGDLRTGRTSGRWRLSRDWYTPLGQTSANGKHVAVWATPESNSPLQPEDGAIARIGLVSAKAETVEWAALLTSKRTGPEAMIRRVVPSDDGSHVAVAGWENGVAMVDTRKKRVAWIIKPRGERAVKGVAFTPDSKMIYAGGATGALYGMKAETGELVSTWWANPSGDDSEYWHEITTVSVSPDGRFVAVGTVPDGLVFVYSTKDTRRRLLHPCGPKGGLVDFLSFSPDSNRLATQADRQLKVWNLSEKTAGR